MNIRGIIPALGGLAAIALVVGLLIAFAPRESLSPAEAARRTCDKVDSSNYHVTIDNYGVDHGFTVNKLVVSWPDYQYTTYKYGLPSMTLVEKTEGVLKDDVHYRRSSTPPTRFGEWEIVQSDDNDLWVQFWFLPCYSEPDQFDDFKWLGPRHLIDDPDDPRFAVWLDSQRLIRRTIMVGRSLAFDATFSRVGKPNVITAPNKLPD